MRIKLSATKILDCLTAAALLRYHSSSMARMQRNVYYTIKACAFEYWQLLFVSLILSESSFQIDKNW